MQLVRKGGSNCLFSQEKEFDGDMSAVSLKRLAFMKGRI